MSTDTTEVPSALRQVFSQVLRVDEHQIQLQSSTKTTRNWDSLRHVELVVAIEERYGVSFSAAEVFALTSVQGFCDILADKGVDLLAA